MNDDTRRQHVGHHSIRVRYCETDRMGVAHHGSHVDWIEEARTEWLRDLDLSYREMEDAGHFLQVVDVHVAYRAPVTYDDVVLIETKLAETRRVSFTIAYTLTREHDGVLIAKATTSLACVDRNGKLQRLSVAFVSD